MRADLTLAAIDAALEKDQGVQFERNLRKRVAEQLEHAREPRVKWPFSFRLGASSLGHDCERHLWYGYKWAKPSSMTPRALRIVQRGNAEEATFAAMLDLIDGVEVNMYAEKGQHSASAYDGVVVCKVDAMVTGIPEMQQTMCAEFKTCNRAAFSELLMAGVKAAKPQHYGQMQVACRLFGMKAALYMAVRKDDDALHIEIVPYDEQYAGALLNPDRIARLTGQHKPQAISEEGKARACMTCQYRDICLGRSLPLANCRNCTSWHRVEAIEGCHKRGIAFPNEQFVADGCGQYEGVQL